MKVNVASIAVLVAVAGCGAPAGVCKSVACATGGNSYESCARTDGSVSNSFGSASCSCAAGGACQECAQLIASWCGSGVGGNGVRPGNGIVDRVVGGLDDAADCTPDAGAATAQFVFDSIVLPRSRTDYALDLTGSGQPVNRYGDILAALTQQGFDAQPNVDSSLQSGQTVMLLAEASADASLLDDSCAAVAVQAGAPTTFAPTPGARYSTAGAPADFAGPLAAGSFSSAPPAMTKKPVTLLVSLPIFSTMALPLHLIGAHVQLSNRLGKIEAGQINGAIPKHDIDTQVIPSLAQMLEAKIMADQGNLTQTDMQLLSLFDTGGAASTAPATGCPTTACTTTCQNPAAAAAHACACAAANDGYIDECEVATNSIVQSTLAPDVQMLDAAGNYAPQPQGTKKDSLSIGFGFTAIAAHF